jgi:hypothetical protein
MANQKVCRRCCKLKDTTQFSKRKASSDGLQGDCKECNTITNKKFRTEIDPKHHERWQKSNWDKFVSYIKKYRKADKSGIIYAIINPEGETYIGMSEMRFNVRMIEHRKHYRQFKQGKRTSLPGLHDSFDKYGLENHRFETILELEKIDRKQLEYIERSFIDVLQQQNKSLNTRNW